MLPDWFRGSDLVFVCNANLHILQANLGRDLDHNRSPCGAKKLGIGLLWGDTNGDLVEPAGWLVGHEIYLIQGTGLNKHHTMRNMFICFPALASSLTGKTNVSILSLSTNKLLKNCFSDFFFFPFD